MMTTYASNMNRSGNVAVDLSQIRDILDICSTSYEDSAIKAATTNHPLPTPDSRHTNSSHWVRLSRRPSIDQLDDDGSPLRDLHTPEPRRIPRDSTGIANIGPSDSPDQSTPIVNDPSLQFAQPEFSADLLFNGISQNVSSWWSTFDSYDPDCTSF
jgi:hypothetical protein